MTLWHHFLIFQSSYEWFYPWNSSPFIPFWWIISFLKERILRILKVWNLPNIGLVEKCFFCLEQTPFLKIFFRKPIFITQTFFVSRPTFFCHWTPNFELVESLLNKQQTNIFERFLFFFSFNPPPKKGFQEFRISPNFAEKKIIKNHGQHQNTSHRGVVLSCLVGGAWRSRSLWNIAATFGGDHEQRGPWLIVFFWGDKKLPRYVGINYNKAVNYI